jgi:hypothetical protein
MRACLVSVLCVLCLPWAAASTDVGSVDFFRVQAPSAPADGDCLPLEGKFSSVGSARAHAVLEGDFYEVVLKGVHIDNDYFRGDGLFSPDSVQLALVVRASEMSQTASENGVDRFGPASAEAGRVVYYSSDVRKGQFLNFGQITIAGPVRYGGAPVMISVFAIEVDSKGDNQKISALFGTLAALGKSVTTPLAPAFSVLETLGTSLINGNRDDLMMRFDTDARSLINARSDLTAIFLRYGDYIIVREQIRDAPTDITRLRYKPSARTVYTGTGCQPGSEFRRSYGIVQINKSDRVAFAQQQQFSALRASIDADSVNDAETLSTAAKTLAASLDSEAAYKRLNATLAAVEPADAQHPPTARQRDDLVMALTQIRTAIAVRNDPGKAVAGTAYPSQAQLEALRLRVVRLMGQDATLADAFDVNATYSQIAQRWK